MRLGVPKERRVGESRVAVVPEVVGKLVARKVEVVVERGAGEGALIPDAAYAEAGAQVADKVNDAEIVVKVSPPEPDEVATYKKGAVVIGFLGPLTNPATTAALAEAGVTAFAMEAIPRISRAQSMDALSSQANVAGYKAAL